jgi:asparagine synthase (glutamine-hydrolysing)
VTVALSGDGADELFAGYNRYAAATLIERYGWFTRTLLYAPTRALLERLPAKRERRTGALVSQMKRAIRSMDARPPHRFANWMRTSDDRTFARLLQNPATAPAIIEEIVQLLWSHRPSSPHGENRGEDTKTNDLNAHLAVEWQLSLPDDMLTKVDLMSMAHGLEVRSPFLDYRLVEAVFPMPWQWKLCGWKKKHLLVEAFKDDLPRMLHNRPKKGFEVPVGVWLRGPLYNMARDLISNDRCFFGPLLSREGAQQTLDDHAAGRADHNFCLWALVSLLAWQQQHAPNASVSSF